MTYTVKPGDTLSKIATRNGMTLAQLLQANPQIKDPNRISVGDVDQSSRRVRAAYPAVPTDNTQPLPFQRHARCARAAAGALGKALADELGRCRQNMKPVAEDQARSRPAREIPAVFPTARIRWRRRWAYRPRFVTQPGFPWAQDFQDLTAGTAPFTAVWKRIAAEQTDAFQKAQHEYIKKTHYDLLGCKDTHRRQSRREHAAAAHCRTGLVHCGPARRRDSDRASCL